MPIFALGDVEPEIHPAAYVHPDAVIIGNVRLGEEASVWPCAVLRGHHAHLEGCAVGDRCLIGSGSITLNRAIVGEGALVGAGALVPEGFKVPPGSIALGVPCRIRDMTQPEGWIDEPMQAYLESGRRFRAELRRIR